MDNNWMLIGKNIGIYFIVINVVSFLIMWYDKHEAKVGDWRVKESTLFGFALFGGSIGGLIGMKVFHHKTKKWYFKIGFPVIIIIQIILAGYLLYRLRG